MEGYYPRPLTVVDIENRIKKSYPFNETIVLEGTFVKHKPKVPYAKESSWKGGFLVMGTSCLPLSNGNSLSLDDETPMYCEGYLKMMPDNSLWNDLGYIEIRQCFEVRKPACGKLYSLLKDKQAEKPFEIRQSVGTRKQRICVVTPESSTSYRDFGETLGQQDRCYSIDHVELSYVKSTSQEYAERIVQLKKSDDYDAICFLSGGRDNSKSSAQPYGVLHEDCVIEALAMPGTPCVSALGHSNEYHLFELAFSQSFPNPATLGTSLREAAMTR